MRKSFKYRLWTNANQERELDIMLETHRHLYNLCLEHRRDSWKWYGVGITYCEQSRWFCEGRASNKYFLRINVSSAQATMRRLDKAYQSFFRRIKQKAKAGYPRFKASDRFTSIEFPSHGDGIRLKDSTLRIQHIGLVRVKLHRPVQGTIKTLTLKKEAGKWYLIVSCDLGDNSTSRSMLPPVGIDVGIESFLATSTGDFVGNPSFLKQELPELRRSQRSVSRKKKGGINRRKAVRKVQQLHLKVRNKRREFHYQIANNLIDRYGTFAVESLNIKGMLRNHRLSRAISDAGWAAFVNILRAKAESAGAIVMEIDPKNTSQECSSCFILVPKKLSVRIHECPFCGLVLHRDINAARNILNRALQARTVPVGHNRRKQSSVSEEAVSL